LNPGYSDIVSVKGSQSSEILTGIQ